MRMTRSVICRRCSSSMICAAVGRASPAPVGFTCDAAYFALVVIVAVAVVDDMTTVVG